MKTTVLIFLSFFLVLPGPLKMKEKGQKTESEFNFFTQAGQNQNFPNQVLSNSSIPFLSIYTPVKKNSAEAVRISVGITSSSSKSINPVFEIFSEEEINLENWMTELSEFSKEADIFSEDDIQIEDWMTGLNEFTKEVIIVDEEIQIEEWMTNVINFAVEKRNFEEDIKLEEWMKDLNYWKDITSPLHEIPESEPESDLPVEKWMTEPQLRVK